MSFRSLPKSETLNELESLKGVMALILRYFTKFSL